MPIDIKFGFPFAQHQEISRYVTRYDEYSNDLTKFFKSLMGDVQKQIKKNFLAGGLPNAWKRHSKSYRMNRQAGRVSKGLGKQLQGAGNVDKVLILTGRLFRASTVKGAPGNLNGVSKDGMKFGIDPEEMGKKGLLPYAAIHQLGGTIPAHTIDMKFFGYNYPMSWKSSNVKLMAKLKQLFGGPAQKIYAWKVNIPDVKIPARPYIKLNKEFNMGVSKKLHYHLRILMRESRKQVSV